MRSTRTKRGGRAAAAALSLCALALASAQDAPKKGDEKPASQPASQPAEKAPDEKGRPAAPDVSKAAPVGQALPENTVPRQNLYPLEEGRRWAFKLWAWLENKAGGGPVVRKDEPRVHELKLQVGEPQKVEVEGGPAKSARTMEGYLDGEMNLRQFFLEEEGDLRCARRVMGIGDHAKDYPIAPPLLVLPKELPVGKKWTWEGKIGTTSGTAQYEVLREERVQVPAGSFDCVVVHAVVTADDETRAERTQWLAPNVGIVREESDVHTPTDRHVIVGELVSFEKRKP